MCLTCNSKVGVQGEDLKQLFIFKTKKKEKIYFRAYLHTHDNNTIELTQEQKDEIMENALAVIPTGIDLSIDIWGIQWPNDYKVKTFSTTAA